MQEMQFVFWQLKYNPGPHIFRTTLENVTQITFPGVQKLRRKIKQNQHSLYTMNKFS